MHNYTGEIAALITAFFWTATSMFFEAAGKKIGSLSVNLIRLTLAFFLIGFATWFTGGLFLPIDATLSNWLWLSLSGIIGLTIGDLLLFQSLIVIGARLAMLIMSLSPPLAAIAGWLILGEKMSMQGILGMFVTLTGIVLVIINKPVKNSGNKKRKFEIKNPMGLLLALGGAAGQAIGIVLSKKGMEGYTVLGSTHIRIISGLIGFIIVFAFMRRWKKLGEALKNKRALLLTSAGAFFGPFLGISFSLLAVKYTSAGIAQTLMSIVPVIIIVPSVIIFKEKITIKEIVGAFIAVGGVVLFFV